MWSSRWFAVTLLAVHADAERASDGEQDKIEFSFYGHFVGHRPGGATQAQAQFRVGDTAEGNAGHSAIAELQKGAVSLAELAASSIDDKSAARSKAHSDTTPVLDTNVSLVQVDEANAEDKNIPGRSNRGSRWQGCKQNSNAGEMCKSLCYRVWCSATPYADCSDFTEDLASIGGWATPEGRFCQSSGCQTDTEYAIDIWYEDMKRNIPDHELNYYINNLRGQQNAAKGGGMSASVRKKFSRPLEKVLGAFALRQAYDKAATALKKGSGTAGALQNLESSISDVDGKPLCSAAMTKGLSFSRGLASKLSIMVNLEKATSEGKPLRRSTDEKADAVLMSLHEYREKARDKMDDAYEDKLKEADTMYDQIKDNLRDYFVNNIHAAKNATFSSGDVPIKAMGNLKPLITRMKKCSPIFDDAEELPAAREAYEEIEGNLRRGFQDQVTTGTETLDRMAAQSELKMVRQDLRTSIKQAKNLPDEFKDEIDKMETTLAQIEAWDALQLGLSDGQEAKTAKDSYDDQYSADQAPTVASPGPAPPPPKKNPKQAREKAHLDRLVERATGRLRKGIDACNCAKMPDNFIPEVDKAEELGQGLGGLPKAVPCQVKGATGGKKIGSLAESKGKSTTDKWWSSIFGGGQQTKPAAFISLVLMFFSFLSSI